MDADPGDRVADQRDAHAREEIELQFPGQRGHRELSPSREEAAGQVVSEDVARAHMQGMQVDKLHGCRADQIEIRVGHQGHGWREGNAKCHGLVWDKKFASVRGSPAERPLKVGELHLPLIDVELNSHPGHLPAWPGAAVVHIRHVCLFEALLKVLGHVRSRSDTLKLGRWDGVQRIMCTLFPEGVETGNGGLHGFEPPQIAGDESSR